MTPPLQPLRIAVCGASLPGPRHDALAEEVGARLAEAGAVLLCGGLTGVMEAAARGAVRNGGLTIGILPGTDGADANEHIVLPLPSGMGEMRNMLLVRFADAVIAVGGEWGTLSEVAFAMRIGTPVIVLAPTLAQSLPVDTASTAIDAVDRALAAAQQRRQRHA
jgi:uncharacterized protein (TIGR00725 family)